MTGGGCFQPLNLNPQQFNKGSLEIRLSKPLLGFEYMFLLELFTFLWYNVSTSLGLNIFIGVCCLKNTNFLEIVAVNLKLAA